MTPIRLQITLVAVVLIVLTRKFKATESALSPASTLAPTTYFEEKSSSCATADIPIPLERKPWFNYPFTFRQSLALLATVICSPPFLVTIAWPWIVKHTPIALGYVSSIVTFMTSTYLLLTLLAESSILKVKGWSSIVEAQWPSILENILKWCTMWFTWYNCVISLCICVTIYQLVLQVIKRFPSWWTKGREAWAPVLASITNGNNYGDSNRIEVAEQPATTDSDNQYVAALVPIKPYKRDPLYSIKRVLVPRVQEFSVYVVPTATAKPVHGQPEVFSLETDENADRKHYENLQTPEMVPRVPGGPNTFHEDDWDIQNLKVLFRSGELKIPYETPFGL